MRSVRVGSALPWLGLVLALSGCGEEDSTAQALRPLQPIAIPKPMLAGRVSLPEGGPAAGARLRFFPSHQDSAPSEAVRAVDSARADWTGRYRVDSLPDGEYNILGELEGLAVIGRDVRLEKGNSKVLDLELAEPGTVTGRIRVQPNHGAGSASVRVPGTPLSTVADQDGRFVLGGIPPGAYTLHVVAGLDGYATGRVDVVIAAGETGNIPDPIEIPFLGIPVVTGLEAVLDTLAGTARLSWKRTPFEGFGAYVPYRRPKTASGETWIALGRTRDTAWNDVLYPGNPSSGQSAQDPGGRDWEYRILARSVDDEEGEPFETASLHAVPPSVVSTSLGFEILGAVDARATLQDTVRLVVHFQNPSRNLMKVIWQEAGEDETSREVALAEGARRGSDTLAIVGSRLGTRTLECRVMDDGRKIWEASVGVEFVADPPKVSAGVDTAGIRGQAMTLKGTAASRLQGIRRMEWDLGSNEDWVPTEDGSIELVLPDTFATLACIFRAVNGDGETAEDTVRVSSRLALVNSSDAPCQGTFGNLLVFKDRLWMIGGLKESGQEGMAWSSADGISWREETGPPSVFDRNGEAAFTLNDTLWVVGGSRPSQPGETGSWFSADGTTWTATAGPVGNEGPVKAAHFGGKVVLCAHDASKVWETSDGRTWFRLPMHPRMGETHINLMVGMPSAVLIGGRYGATTVWAYQGEPDLREWALEPPHALSGLLPGAVWYGGRAFVFGGRAEAADRSGRRIPLDEESVYSSLQGTVWEREPLIRIRIRSGSPAAVFRDRIWIAHQGSLLEFR